MQLKVGKTMMSSIEGLILIAIGFAAGIAVSTIVFHYARKRSISYLFSRARRKDCQSREIDDMILSGDVKNP